MDLSIGRFCCVLLSLFAGLASGLEITTTGPTSIEKACGQSVKLDCQFSLAPEDSGPLFIEWNLLASDRQKEDNVLILYAGDRAYEDYYAPMEGRIHFSSAFPKHGDASINLTELKLSDSGTYHVRVKKVPGVDDRKFLLKVMPKPSKPRCYAEGPTHEGKDIVLKCLSMESTNTLLYSWERTSDNKLLPASAVMDPVGGTLNVREASTSASGTYLCTVRNRVATEQCVLYLNVTPPPNTGRIIAGAITAVLLILIIIAILLFCYWRARHRKKYEKETSNEIIEDAPPPKRRISTVSSFNVGSQHSSLGSMSNLYKYNRMKPQPIYMAMKPESEYMAMKPESEYMAMKPESEYMAMKPESEYMAMKPESEYMAMKPESDYVVMKPQHAKIPPSEEFERHGTSRTWTESDASSQPSKGGSSHVKTKPIKRSHAEEDQESDASSQPRKGI
ncbi:Coxsackievirus and adenovirus receptor -like protein [Collichthys lucidus]|uniref:Coxsackievirus and adenovirus receptor-like protein n=1 Tax=Collichthys lucidus TaxID=240159 RepID=A0A4U5TZU3_COLLU|nr:Coxsackievirus and adenovirus receptor -like protein [Collichthys lucidus]